MVRGETYLALERWWYFNRILSIILNFKPGNNGFKLYSEKMFRITNFSFQGWWNLEHTSKQSAGVIKKVKDELFSIWDYGGFYLFGGC